MMTPQQKAERLAIANYDALTSSSLSDKEALCIQYGFAQGVEWLRTLNAPRLRTLNAPRRRNEPAEE